ncbi:actin-related protein 2/3 complex subunit 5-like [Mercenaria mercenaria]|uniref:actin-related protein 2/3 complex subunit 5-like n=1 Tax=Mercenaria mercenaria TaxID=6596 RepID=UPI001E1D82C0|nr:actin-related protein 2/3 complex subunit 5-like [Mercenaria mercenaria]
MSKNTSSNKFRKVNVDDYDPENFKDEMVEGEEQGPNESEVNTFLTQGKNVDALEVILRNPPLGAKSQAVKDKAVALAIRVLTSFKTSEIEGAVKSLDTKLLDVLMKYIYRGFEFPSEGSSASLLTWHEKVYAAGGAGCIVRVLTDRKRV